MGAYEVLNAEHVCSESDPFTIERYRIFARHLPTRCERVLDIGCNTGRGGEALKRRRPLVHLDGIDCVADRVERLPAAYEHRLVGLSNAIPAEDCSYSAVTAGEFIEHLRPLDVDVTLAEIFRVLVIGGRLLLTTPNPGDIKRRLRGGSVLGGAHLSQHHPDVLRLKLRMIGFSHVRILGCGKTTRYLGSRFPLLVVYGSYLALADKS